MDSSEANPSMESIHIEADTFEKGAIVITTKREYLLDRATGQVTLTETVDIENPYPNARQAKEQKISAKIIPTILIPPVIREKVKTIMEAKKKTP